MKKISRKFAALILMLLTAGAWVHPLAAEQADTNLALGKSVIGLNVKSDSVNSLVDGDLNQRAVVANTTTKKGFVCIDLGDNMKVNKIEVVLRKLNDSFRLKDYNIRYQTDISEFTPESINTQKDTWSSAAGGTLPEAASDVEKQLIMDTNTNNYKIVVESQQPIYARYVLLDVLDAYVVGGVHVAEMRVFGAKASTFGVTNLKLQNSQGAALENTAGLIAGEGFKLSFSVESSESDSFIALAAVKAGDMLLDLQTLESSKIADHTGDFSFTAPDGEQITDVELFLISDLQQLRPLCKKATVNTWGK